MGTTDVDSLYSWALPGVDGYLEVCKDAANFSGSFYSTYQEPSPYKAAAAAARAARPAHCKDWPFNSSHPWNFTNVITHEASKREECELPVDKAYGRSDWDIAVSEASVFLKRCYTLTPSAAEIDSQVAVIHKMAYEVGILGGMSDAAA